MAEGTSLLCASLPQRPHTARSPWFPFTQNIVPSTPALVGVPAETMEGPREPGDILKVPHLGGRWACFFTRAHLHRLRENSEAPGHGAFRLSTLLPDWGLSPWAGCPEPRAGR